MKIYFITPNDYEIHELEKMVTEVLEAGVEIIQYRDKNISKDVFLSNAKRLKKIVDSFGKTFIVNDYLDVALEIGADVHLGKTDDSIEDAKAAGVAVIGASAKTLLDAKRAIEKGATYLGVGSMFNTTTKDHAELITSSDLNEIIQNTDVPIYLIGGINEENCTELLGLNVDGICMISAITKDGKYKENVERIIEKCTQLK